ncbi:hypothetical protein GALMADRAFT_230988 [Galerina marginata CBS 339.88]|uniref:Uncharacterized protein n=1 Tax=Galerina marginata (strain CBS 339.88) TaxID=685588 RepID=A0A067SF73_GALM3|nr:hypothetical protein GALMADRAFT_230988 [Galerina marginata CBS 339.88]
MSVRTTRMEEQQEAWHLTVVLLEGLRLMRPEKAWRPIVTVEIDKHHIHETTLGVDGQCVNQKEVFRFYDAKHSSQVEVNIWHRSQSKKKKRKILVASACHSLGELVKKQETEPKLEVRLQCRTGERSGMSGRGRPQKGAVLRLKLREPPCLARSSIPSRNEEEVEERPSDRWRNGGSSDGDTDDSSSVDTEIITLDDVPPPAQSTIRRRIKGYAVNSDDDMCSTDGGEYIPDDRPLQDDNSYTNTCVDDDDDEYSKALVYRLGSSGEVISLSPREDEDGWLAFSPLPLPLYTEKLTVPRDLTRAERVLASMTMYAELAAAETEDDFEPVFRRLQHEWTFIGGLLVALAAVDTAVFSISPGSIFNVDSWAKGAIATSSIASGLGIACDAWFLLRYHWADLRTFIARARDLYNSYFFFSLSARVPAFCMFISAVSLMAFLGLVAFDAWPQGVLALSFIVGIVMSMQFLVYGAHWCANRVAQGGRASGRGVVRVVKVVRSMTGGSVV